MVGQGAMKPSLHCPFGCSVLSIWVTRWYMLLCVCNNSVTILIHPLPPWSEKQGASPGVKADRDEHRQETVWHTLSCMADQDTSTAIKDWERRIFWDRFKFAGTAVIRCFELFPFSRCMTYSFSLALCWSSGWMGECWFDSLSTKMSAVQKLGFKRNSWWVPFVRQLKER